VHQGRPITYRGDVDDLELSGIPQIDDFGIRFGEPTEGGRHIEYASASLGTLASFPAWDHPDRDLRHFIPSDVPMGSIANPYEDADEGWRIVIFESEGSVYVLQADDPNAEEFPVYFRVTRADYLGAWAVLLHQYNPVLSLDDLLAERAASEADA
jgi:hypothetical protein